MPAKSRGEARIPYCLQKVKVSEFPRLYRRRSKQSKTSWKTPDVIYKIHMPLLYVLRTQMFANFGENSSILENNQRDALIHYSGVTRHFSSASQQYTWRAATRPSKVDVPEERPLSVDSAMAGPNNSQTLCGRPRRESIRSEISARSVLC